MGATDQSGRHDTDGDDSSLGGRSDSFGLDFAPLDLPAGIDLGGVTIVRLIAEGGMGRVYEGRQQAPDRPVAVKVLRSGLASRRLVRRFEREAHLLARLKHPHIAQVHTFGRFRLGHVELPFFVLELVDDARPVDVFARDRHLTVRDRVALLARFAAAVGHAHALGVVHRDLKPGNLLVAADGGPKVIDFGVARAVAADAAPATLQTHAGEIVGTLRYMAPEQCAADADAIDARVDVHALGLVLHELLTGGLPYDVRGRSLVAAAEIIRGQDAGAMRSVPRSVIPAGIDRAAAERLAAIVEKCLRKSPADRYASGTDLADDLGRWLAGEPVGARPPSLAERLDRWLRRHRAAAAAAAIAVLSVGVAAAGIIHATRRAQHRESAARRETARAAEERAWATTAAFTARLEQAAAARATGALPDARRLVAEAAAMLAPGADSPAELAFLAAAVAEPLDTAIAVLGPHAARVTAVAANAPGDTLLTAAEDGSVRLWGRGDGGWLPSADLVGHRGGVWAAAFSPDGKRVATASADRTVRLWDLAGGGGPTVLSGHRGGVYGVAFSPDGREIATGAADDAVRLWDSATGTLRATLSGHSATVFGLAFAPDGRLLASAGGDGTVRLWDPVDGRPVATLTGHARRVFNVAFAPDGRSLVSAGEDATSRIWNLPDGVPAAVLRHPERVNAVAYSAAGDRVATASTDGLLRLWDPVKAEVVSSLRGHSAGIWSLAACGGSASPSWLTGSADKTARVWDSGLDPEPRLACGSPVLGVALSADDLAAAALASGEIVLWDPASCRELRRLRAGRGRASAVDFSPDDGRIVAAAGGDGGVRLWRTGDGTAVGELAGHRGKVFGVAFAPDGRLVASCGEDRTARIRAVPTGPATDAPPAGDGDPGRTLPHPQRVYGVAWSPAADSLATACEDGVVRIWPVPGDAPPLELAGHGDAVNGVTFSRDGSRLVSCSSDGTVRLWDARDGRPIATLPSGVGQVWEVAISPAGDRLVAAGGDGRLQLFATTDGRPLVALGGHAGRVWSLAFSTDGRLLVSGSADGTARVWGLSAADVAARRQADDAAAGSAPP